MTIGNEFTHAYKSEYELGITTEVYNVSFMWIVVSICGAVVSGICAK